MKKIFSDWKFYVMIVSMVMLVFVDIVSEDYISAVWVVLAFVLWCQIIYFKKSFQKVRR